MLINARRRAAALFTGLRPKHLWGSISHKSSASASHPLAVENRIPKYHIVGLPSQSEDETNDSSRVASESISPEVLKVVADKIASGYTDSFMVCDLRQIRQRHELWLQHFPRVQPFYAMKCNDDPRVLEVLASLGCGFDCASWKEIEVALPLVQPNDIIYANPCKQQSHLEKASEHGVSLMTFDNSDELYKTQSTCPEAQCVLRLATNDADAVCQLSNKFGCDISEVPSLLSLACSLDLNVVGVSFHCGSGNYNKAVYVDALNRSRDAFELGAQAGFDFKLLDIGGGFPGEAAEDDTFVEIANSMAPQLNCFDDDVRLIAEPGRFYAASAQTSACRVFSMKKNADRSVKCYINDGLYGSFNNIMYDHANPIPEKFISPDATTPTPVETLPTTIFGPTCDGLDCIIKNMPLPRMERDDWFLFGNMGAYTNVGGSTFNGMPRPKFEYIH